MKVAHMLPRTVYTIIYQCRNGIDDNGVVEAFWTGEIDTWGKRTLRPVDGSPTLYLFDNEITDIEEL